MKLRRPEYVPTDARYVAGGRGRRLRMVRRLRRGAVVIWALVAVLLVGGLLLVAVSMLQGPTPAGPVVTPSTYGPPR